MFSLQDLFGGPDRDIKKALDAKEEAAQILRTSPEALEAFIAAYEKGALPRTAQARHLAPTANRRQKSIRRWL